MQQKTLKRTLVSVSMLGIALSVNLYAQSTQPNTQQEAKNSNNSYSNENAQKVLLQSSVTTQALMSELPIELQAKQVSVLNQDTLLETNIGGGGIQSVLEKVPGIIYSRSGGINGQLTIRGQNSNSTRSIVMIDGVRFSGRNTLEFNTLDPYAFQSIEVIRGPASSLWGADAMNGVINLRSRISNYNINGDTFKATARIRALEYASVNNMFGGRLEVLGGGNGFDVLVGLSTKVAQDYVTPITENGSNKAKNSKYNMLGVDFNAGYTHNATRYYLQGRYTRVESHRAGGLGAAPGSSYGILMSEVPITEYYLRAGAKSHNLSFVDSMEAYVYYRQWDTDIWNNRLGFSNGSTNIHQEVYNNHYIGGRLVFDGTYGKHTLTYGGEIHSAISPTQVRQNNLVSGVSNTTNRPSTNTDFAIFLKDDFRATNSWFLSASLRGDYILTTISKTRSSVENTQIASNNAIAIETARLLDENGIIHNAAITGSLGSVWFITDYISNVINLSHNFKDPGTGTRMASTPSGSSTLTVGNPLIKPEYSQTAEFGFRFQSENHWLSLIGFFTNYTNMIALSSYQNATITTQNSSALYRSENIGKAIITGVELEGRHSFLDSMIVLSYVGSYNYGQNLTDNKPIAYLAPLYGSATLQFNLKYGYVNLTERFYGKKTRIDAQEERAHKAYAMTDIYLGLKLESFWESCRDMDFILGISNLFNQVGRNPVTVENISYPIALTNPLVDPGRSYNAKFVWKY